MATFMGGDGEAMSSIGANTGGKNPNRQGYRFWHRDPASIETARYPLIRLMFSVTMKIDRHKPTVVNGVDCNITPPTVTKATL